MTQLSLVMEKDYRKSSLVLWTIFFVGIMLFVGLNQADRSVLHHYVGAAQAWMHGENLYLTNGRGFLYFPQCAILFIPLSFLPKLFGELLWRGLSILFYAYAIFSWLNLNKTKIFYYIVTCNAYCFLELSKWTNELSACRHYDVINCFRESREVVANCIYCRIRLCIKANNDCFITIINCAL